MVTLIPGRLRSYPLLNLGPYGSTVRFSLVEYIRERGKRRESETTEYIRERVENLTVETYSYWLGKIYIGQYIVIDQKFIPVKAVLADTTYPSPGPEFHF